MTNHPNRKRGPYTADISGAFGRQNATAEFATIRSALEWARQNGVDADHCTIREAKGRVVACYPLKAAVKVITDRTSG